MTSRAESCPPKLVPRSATIAAAQAFSALPANPNPSAKPLSSPHGAAAAAAAAAAGNNFFIKNGPAPRSIKQQDVHQPVPIKSPSHSAAQAASARASPQKDVVLEKPSSEPIAIYAVRKSPKPIGDPMRKQKTGLEEYHSRVRPWLDNTIAIPQPVRPLPASAALAAILGLEPETSPGSTPHSASPPFMTASSMHSPPTQIERTGSETVQDTNTSIGYELESAASSAMQRTSSVSEVTNIASGRQPESAASSAMKRTTSSNEGLQSASKSPLKHAIAADAIIAWSVASSRAASPAKVVPSPTSRRRSKSFGLFHHHEKHSEHEFSKPHVPIHVLKHTLRKHHQGDEDDEENGIVKRGRRHFIRKHQHKHHEGDRKRWRDRVTDRERKRYEGVWAANRGLYTFWDFSTKPPTEMDAVLNLVVREVWERSRLPRGELEEVWDLVARENANTLRRDEFVVGMWLLDQRLKGRKLPMRVSPSVWASVRHTLKIRARP
jgi:hypothetical protein